ncbi:3',2',5'-bisphosphate nucleotidase [Nitzschia inconspicua]|uniref:3'(2'),5'-bisphosphate nucleotidase n=1 Tax=Nitzschia inconspicua TaxID=303405 RepID=A0A9K3KGM4_9STRA|nr:3',2',5'-bisphosphate nucleotidase [Nitzschia inconspicua]
MSTDCNAKVSADTFQKESDFPKEVKDALRAIRKACEVTRKVQSQIIQTNKSDEVTQTKLDKSPVTIADYAAQAIILKELRESFPEDVFLAEESSNGLQEDLETGGILASKIQELTGTETKAALFDAIDIGKGYYLHRSNQNDPNRNPDRFWCLDPIDGTKGFLRKGQYCIALALLERGSPTIGILACPNLLVGNLKDNNKHGEDSLGCIFVACKGKGCYEIGLDNSSSHFHRLGYRSDSMLYEDPVNARFCVAVEQGFNDPDGTTIAIGKVLHGGLDSDGEILHCTRMDSQVKYGVIARGDAEFYVRLPKNHKDNIWDVAAGVLCLEEVGGKVTDTTGNPLDFSCGGKLPTAGILGARTEKLHESLLQGYATAIQGIRLQDE